MHLQHMHWPIRRRRVEAELTEAIASGEPLVFLVAPRGSGKTTLLQTMGAARPGARLVRLEPITSSPEILEREFRLLAGALLPDSSNGAPPFEALLRSVRSRAQDSLLLLDDITELRTLSYFPKVTHPFESFVEALGKPGGAPCIATSRFGYWIRAQQKTTGKQPRTIVLPPLSAEELEEAGVADAARVAQATGGLVVHAAALARIMHDENIGLEQAMAQGLEFGNGVEAECRATLADLLHRARGYGACKAALSVLATEQGLTLSEVARRMNRTPGSTRDYLRWLEEVELVVSRKKRYFYVDPILRLWMRLYGSGRLPEASQTNDVIAEFVEDASPEPQPESEPAFILPPARSEDFLEID